MHDRRTIRPSDRPFRVLLVDPNANTPPYDRALGQALAAEGCRVELLTSHFRYETLGPAEGIAVRELFFRLVGSRLVERAGFADRPFARRALKAAEYPLDWLLALARIATRPRRSRPDVVHIQWSVQPKLDRLLWRGLQGLGLPVVYTAHNLLPHQAGPDDAAQYGALYRAADGIVVHSERTAGELRDRWGVSSARVAVAPHGPLLEAHPPVERVAARQTLGLPPDAEIVLFAGLIEPYKGLPDTIAAFETVAARRPLARLVVAGKPNEPFEPHRQHLRARGLLDRTTLDLQFLPEARLAAYLCAADVVVLPYYDATSSGLLFAARRFGRAVVTTDVGDFPEIVADGESGLLVPPRQPDRLADAIVRLLASPDLATRLGAVGQQAAFGPGGWAEAARRTVALYRRLTEPHTPAAFRRGAPIR